MVGYAGFIKSSFIDFPKTISAVVFVDGCNFRCPYCHNSELLCKKESKMFSESEIFNYCIKKKNFLDGVVFSGGEISLYEESITLMEKLKEFGFKIKIDTNGTHPLFIKKLVDQNIVDYIAMDVKAPLDKYSKVAGVDVDIDAIVESIDLIKKSGVDYEFRTTICRELHDKQDIIEIGKLLDGADKFVLQNFKDGKNVLLGEGKFTSFEAYEFKKLAQLFERYISNVSYRLNQ